MATEVLPKRSNPFMAKVRMHGGQGRWTFKEEFVGILRRIYQHPHFPHRACVVYLFVLQHCRSKDRCFLLRQTIADALHLETWTVDEHLKALANAGFLRKKHRPGRSTVFVLLDPDKRGVDER